MRNAVIINAVLLHHYSCGMLDEFNRNINNLIPQRQMSRSMIKENRTYALLFRIANSSERMRIESGVHHHVIAIDFKQTVHEATIRRIFLRNRISPIQRGIAGQANKINTFGSRLPISKIENVIRNDNRSVAFFYQLLSKVFGVLLNSTNVRQIICREDAERFIHNPLSPFYRCSMSISFVAIVA